MRATCDSGEGGNSGGARNGVIHKRTAENSIFYCVIRRITVCIRNALKPSSFYHLDVLLLYFAVFNFESGVLLASASILTKLKYLW